ncbi:MAG: type II toxin-antitoxin system MqsA family antitoxin [Syntrophobacteraceae bacterium]|nr:type II toxin-antitoxin system MqsA family antitoxin [Syntrophobacteraceae bacterium]
MGVNEARRTSALMREFTKHVNASIVDLIFIARVRKKFSLDQREAGEIFGGGVKAFSRYENGKTKPPLPLVKLLKVLEPFSRELEDRPIEDLKRSASRHISRLVFLHRLI